jgi:hypothetical protein
MQLLVPMLQEGVVSALEVAAALLPAVAANANNFAGLVLANAAVAVAAGKADAPGRAAVIEAVASGSVSLVQLTAPGMMRIRKVKQALDKAGDAFTKGAQYAVVSAVAEGVQGAVQDAVGEKGNAAAADALTAWIHEQPASVRSSASFARGVAQEAAFAAARAAQDEDEGASLAPYFASAVAGITVAVSAAAEGGADAAQVGAFVLSGVQVACAADDTFPLEAGTHAFGALRAAAAAGGVAPISAAGFKAWLAAPQPSAAATAAAGALLVAAEPLGRSSVEKALRGEIEKM